FIPFVSAIIKKEAVEGLIGALETIESQGEALENLDVFKIDSTETSNIFNPEEASPGMFVSGTTGTLTANAIYTATGFIPVLPLTDYSVVRKDGSTTAPRARTVAFYNASKTFIGGITTATDFFPTIAGASFMRLSLPSS